MATLKKYNLKGQEIGKLEIDDAFVQVEAHGQMIKDYIVALRANQRQWSANTKTRSEVSHSTKKPHRQKGLGRARQGSLVSPQYRGGGRVGTPKPKFDQHVRINKKERRAALHFLVAEKIKNSKLHILETTDLAAPHTQTIAQFIKQVQLGSRVLFLGEGNYVDISLGDHTTQVSVHCDKHHHFAKSVRNIPKTAFSLVSNINGYDVAIAQDIVITEAALNELQTWLA